MSELVEKLFAIHDALAKASIPHAFGGAVALAYCVEEPRGTRDLDVNIFVDSSKAAETLARLPDGVTVEHKHVAAVRRDGQTRLKWDDTPVDVFLNNVPLHEAVAESVVWVPLAGREIPVLDCASLAIFKAFFDRTKDWADMEAIAQATPEDIDIAAATIAELVSPDDPAVERLESLIPLDVGSGRRLRG
jgi:hypothetical protein